MSQVLKKYLMRYKIHNTYTFGVDRVGRKFKGVGYPFEVLCIAADVARSFGKEFCLIFQKRPQVLGLGGWKFMD